jgi:hypothetical protein
MPVIYQKFIRRQDLRDNPDHVYVFGDNVRRIGRGPRAGQAHEMRGEPNAIGVATKWEPSNRPNAFFSDTVICKKQVDHDLVAVQQALDRGKTVVVPEDGIGTGRARLPVVAPRLNAFINNWFKERTT